MSSEIEQQLVDQVDGTFDSFGPQVARLSTPARRNRYGGFNLGSSSQTRSASGDEGYFAFWPNLKSNRWDLAKSIMGSKFAVEAQNHIKDSQLRTISTSGAIGYDTAATVSRDIHPIETNKYLFSNDVIPLDHPVGWRRSIGVNFWLTASVDQEEVEVFFSACAKSRFDRPGQPIIHLFFTYTVDGEVVHDVDETRPLSNGDIEELDRLIQLANKQPRIKTKNALRLKKDLQEFKDLYSGDTIDSSSAAAGFPIDSSRLRHQLPGAVQAALDSGSFNAPRRQGLFGR